MGGRRTRRGCDFSTKEEAGERKEEALKCFVSLGNSPPKQACLLSSLLARRLTARSVCSLTLHTSPSCPLCFPNCPLVFLPLFLSKASLRCPLLSLSLNPAGPLFPWVTSPKLPVGIHCTHPLIQRKFQRNGQSRADKGPAHFQLLGRLC